MKRVWGRPGRILVGVAAVGLVVSSCGTGDPAALQDFPGTTREQLVVERANPAVLLIETDYKATISVPTIGLNNGAAQALVNQIISEADNGQISSDLKTLLDTFAQGIAGNPNAYFTANAPSTQVPVSAAYQCTGSIVTPDGYVVTAAHCTNPPSDDRQKTYVQTGLQPVLSSAVQQLQSQLSSQGFDADQTKLLSDAAATFASTHAQTTGESETIQAKLFSASSAGQRQATNAPLSVVTQGNAPPASTGPFGDKDVSILKLDGYSDLPTLPVASDTDIDTGQQLFVDGYPAAAENGNANNASTPTVTSGSVSSKKVSDQGVPLIETSTTVSGGNSGGPGLDVNGRMIGVVSYGSAQGSYNYLIGGSVVQEYLREKNIQPRESATSRAYDIALNDFHRQYYRRALPEFQQVKALYPGHPDVDSFIQRSQDAIAQGRDQTPLVDGTALVLVIAGAVIALLVLLAAVVGVIVWSRRQRRGAAGVPPAAPPGWPPPAAAPPQGWAQPQAPPPSAAWHWDGQQWVLVPTATQTPGETGQAPPPAQPGQT